MHLAALRLFFKCVQQNSANVCVAQSAQSPPVRNFHFEVPTFAGNLAASTVLIKGDFVQARHRTCDLYMGQIVITC